LTAGLRPDPLGELTALPQDCISFRGGIKGRGGGQGKGERGGKLGIRDVGEGREGREGMEGKEIKERWLCPTRN